MKRLLIPFAFCVFYACLIGFTLAERVKYYASGPTAGEVIGITVDPDAWQKLAPGEAVVELDASGVTPGKRHFTDGLLIRDATDVEVAAWKLRHAKDNAIESCDHKTGRLILVYLATIDGTVSVTDIVAGIKTRAAAGKVIRDAIEAAKSPAEVQAEIDKDTR